MWKVWLVWIFTGIVLLCGPLGAMAGNVTFRVDLSQEAGISANGVYLMGSMNNFDPAVDSLGHVGGSVYVRTVSFPSGTLIEFKYVNGNVPDNEEILFGRCEYTNYRYLRVPVADTVLPLVCFGYCDSACTPPTGARIACIGNSIFWGAGITDRMRLSPPALLRDSLAPAALVVNFAAPGVALLQNAGNATWNHAQWCYTKAFAPQTALVMLGTNDSKPALWGPYAAQFYPDYDSLVDELQALSATPRILLVCPPKAFFTLFGIQDAVIRGGIIPAIRALARARCLEVVGMYTRTEALSAHFPDGIHPDDSASAVIAAAF